jgi:hypothetical protein
MFSGHSFNYEKLSWKKDVYKLKTNIDLGGGGRGRGQMGGGGWGGGASNHPPLPPLTSALRKPLLRKQLIPLPHHPHTQSGKAVVRPV